MSERPSSSYPDLSRLRLDYAQRSLTEADVDPDPLRQFVAWFQEALKAKAHEPNAMTLASSTADGVPSARIVLLKGVDQETFVFYTNYLSRKGRELDQNPRAALVFYWPELERQVRVEGDVERTSAGESDEYFNSRPPASRIGSAASAQSQPIASRDVLEERVKALRAQFPNGEIPRPPDWGGYRVRPRRVEFWQGRPSRLHDRIEYLRDGGGAWRVRRLSP